jgi:hypothetical protein
MNKISYDSQWSGSIDSHLRIFHMVACAKSKLERKDPTPAKELYCSRWFQLVRRIIEQRNEPWAILSAEYKLLHPDSLVFAYENTLATKTREECEAWADAVIAMAPTADRIVIWGGETYTQHLAPYFNAELPLKGLGIGQQLSLLKKWADPAPPLLETAAAAWDLLNRMEPDTPNDQGATEFEWDTVKAQLRKAVDSARKQMLAA